MIVTLALAPSQALATDTQSAELEVVPTGLRNAKGLIQLCVTQDSRHFPDCSKDPKAIKRSVAAGGGTITLVGLSPGRYALSLVHDENGNGKLDTLLAMPREGFGFSRDPAMKFGPPKFDDVLFDVAPGHNRRNIRVRYLL
ncbi:DUF2141 domain-containing protein [Sphingomonas montanisoli]|uniref:DUF2141 domain-containing protein n=1 Tax=Sphingomonas montanisoli TaxID=2606412 RepID=A0A5D9CB17_9SPHN|nr:DUF2141 domain-containing protein [Sphingomonas montanisoli]TZG27311.1 DUF2141 domain-containing protein [Sphingomonas montanisoli]